MFLKSFLFLQKLTENHSKLPKNAQKRKMFLRFQRRALDVSYGFSQYSPMFFVLVFLIKKCVAVLTNDYYTYIHADGIIIRSLNRILNLQHATSNKKGHIYGLLS